jgi:hypothetical protein
MYMRIAVDIDEVLVPHLVPLAKFHNKQLPVDRKYPYLFREVFNCTEEESQKMIREFYDSRDFVELQPLANSQLALWQISKENTLYAVTGRQEIVRTRSENWLNQHFPGIFHDLVMTNSFTVKEVQKSTVCRALGINVIIDDNYEICKDCFKNNIDVINFIGDPVYPWCEETDIAIKSWDELIVR